MHVSATICRAFPVTDMRAQIMIIIYMFQCPFNVHTGGDHEYQHWNTL